ncbi:MAG TPA: hypothetical protein PKA67_16985 [Amaricoccus sp.]|nr:hypothetical protein [Amaricoccus sp.]
MSGSKNTFSANQSAVGYLYQARLALAECLRYAYSESDIEVSIEKFDDVAFEKDARALKLPFAPRSAGTIVRGGFAKQLPAWPMMRKGRVAAFSFPPGLPRRSRPT